MNALQQVIQQSGAATPAATASQPAITPSASLVVRQTAPRHASCVPLHRVIMAVDIEGSTTRTDPVKAELRSTLYMLFAAALEAVDIHRRHRDAFTDRGDGILALIRPVDQVPKTLLMNQAIPSLARLLAAYNSSMPVAVDPRLRLRLRVVLHVGEVHYDDNGCFGQALDVAFRLLDARVVKKALRCTADPLVLVISDDIFRSVVSHGYDGIDERTFAPRVRIKIARQHHRGWLYTP